MVSPAPPNRKSARALTRAACEASHARTITANYTACVRASMPEALKRTLSRFSSFSFSQSIIRVPSLRGGIITINARPWLDLRPDRGLRQLVTELTTDRRPRAGGLHVQIVDQRACNEPLPMRVTPRCRSTFGSVLRCELRTSAISLNTLLTLSGSSAGRMSFSRRNDGRLCGHRTGSPPSPPPRSIRPTVQLLLRSPRLLGPGPHSLSRSKSKRMQPRRRRSSETQPGSHRASVRGNERRARFPAALPSTP